MRSPLTPVVLGHTPTRIASIQGSQTGGTIRFFGGRSNVGGAAVSHSPHWAQCALCVCAFTAGLSIIDSEGV